MRECWPQMEASIVGLLGRIVENDLKISALHSRRPDTVGEYVRGAELIARDLQSFSRDTPSLVKALELPSWSGRTPAWPPRSRSTIAEMVMGSVPVDFGLEWHEALKARDDQRRADFARAHDRMVAEAKAKEESENAAVREAVAEDQARRASPR